MFNTFNLLNFGETWIFLGKDYWKSTASPGGLLFSCFEIWVWLGLN